MNVIICETYNYDYILQIYNHEYAFFMTASDLMIQSLEPLLHLSMHLCCLVFENPFYTQQISHNIINVIYDRTITN